MIWSYIKKNYLCKHNRYYETRSCDAICCECGKNLGFISNSRTKNPQGEEWRNQPFYPKSGRDAK